MALAAILCLGAALRLATLNLQSYTPEEAVTAARVLHPSLFSTLSAIPGSESTPPLYYVMAWLWSLPFGTTEVALRSLSALFGIATIPIAYLAGRELATARVGLVSAAIVAASPMLVWYSQLARSYALLVLLSSLSFLFTVRVARDANRRDLAGWAVTSSLALTAHYFAVFLVVPEAALLAYRWRSRSVAVAIAAIGAVGLALLPLALHQAGGPNNDWISNQALSTRLFDVPRKLLIGETGAYLNVYGPSAQSSYLDRAALPALWVIAALALLWRYSDWRERAAARFAALLGATALLLPVALALLGADYVLARNLLPAFVPLVIVAACGLGAHRAGRLGVGLAASLCAVLVAFTVYSQARVALRHDDWRDAAHDLGTSPTDRLIVAPFLGDNPLEYYLSGDTIRVRRFDGRIRQVDLVGYGPPRWRPPLPSAFLARNHLRAGYFTVTVYEAPRPLTVKLGAANGRPLVGNKRLALLLSRPG